MCVTVTQLPPNSLGSGYRFADLHDRYVTFHTEVSCIQTIAAALFLLLFLFFSSDNFF